ncbi:MAG: eukaryotic-like serine/threonine-protein kinase [Acidobacteriota bacterium]|jgi:WD40 repeat protein/serine/threonine protein kinase|nr:eukaryotic-like serine/threonine-protein kinase [Acidobacteriota bacterium]
MNSSKSKRWQAVDRLLDEALNVSPSERDLLLRERCGDDVSLRRRVEKLLAATDAGEGFLETPAIGAALKIFDHEATDKFVGATIGNYRLLELIGRGGMGAVYLAMRIDKEFSQKVAIKIVAPFFTDKEAETSFRRERQILAKLSHPNIARLLDGGTTEEGMPFLAMEYVEGATIIDYCERAASPIKARLDLFLEVCGAVKFAHQNLTIHRDLKPSNILVTADGTPKLLDFGLAKLLQPGLFELTGNFTVGANILTPNYASPEQLKNETITTASDVYSLGVILYELLTGKRPHDLKDKSLPEVLRIITEEQPVLPSHVVSNESQSVPPEAAPKSRIENPKSLKGDLDNICLKALAKERTERYQTVEAFRADIIRHLQNLPITARPPALAYRMKKYVRRHQVGVTAAVAILILLLGWLTSAIWQRNTARAQARENLRRAYSADMNLAMLAYETANLTRLREILARYENTDFRLNWEYRFLQNLSEPKGKLLAIPHEAEVWNIAFSPDSSKMATACADGFARIYEVPSGKLLTTTAVQEKNVWRVKFSPDGRFLATASGDMSSSSAKIWDAATGSEFLSLVGHTARVRAIDFSFDGKLIATGSRDKTVRIWDALNGRELKRLSVKQTQAEPEITDVRFTPDGRRLIAANNYSARMWEVSSGKVIFDLAQFALTVAVSPDSKRFALGKTDFTIEIFDAETGKPLLEIARHEAKINDLAFSPDGKIIASASSDRTVRFFEANTGAEIKSLKAHVNDAWSVAFSPDGKYVATGGTDFNSFLFDAAALLPTSSFAVPLSFGGSWAAISADRTKMATHNHGLANKQSIWNIQGKTRIVELSDEVVDAGAFSPDGTVLVTGARDGSIVLWNSTSGAQLKRFKAHDARVTSLSFTPDGKQLVSGSWDKTVRVWNLADGSLVRELCRFENYVSASAISPDGMKVFAASYDTNAKLFDLATGKIIAELGKRRKAILSVAFAPDGQTFATGDADGTIEIRQTSDGKLLDTLTGNAGFIWALTFSPDNARLASASGEGIIRLWDTETKAQVIAIRTGSAMTTILAFTPDGNTLISYGTTEKLKLWEAARLEQASAGK